MRRELSLNSVDWRTETLEFEANAFRLNCTCLVMTVTIITSPYEVLISQLHKIIGTVCYCVTIWKCLAYTLSPLSSNICSINTDEINKYISLRQQIIEMWRLEKKNTEVIYVSLYLIAHGPTLPECFWPMAFRNIQLIKPALPLHTFQSYRFTTPAVTPSLAAAKEFFLKYRLCLS
jgi:hypothetical protein